MKARKIMLFGANGQVGRALLATGDKSIKAFSRGDVDLAKPERVRASILDESPDFVINAAAYTAVDQAESEPDLATAINTRAPGVMAEACQQAGAVLIHYSTDYVFDGSGTRPYKETDATAPLGVYGRTKLDGEQAIASALHRHVILRTAWVYDRQGKNFVNTMLRLGRDPERASLNVVADQHGTPTFADDLAAATLKIVDRVGSEDAVGDGSRWGVFHATGSGETTWHGFAQKIFEVANVSVVANPITTEEYPTPAPRPAYSVLDNSRLHQTFDIRLPQWPDALKRCLN